MEAGAGEAKARARADESFFLLDFAAISVVFQRKRVLCALVVWFSSITYASEALKPKFMESCAGA